VKGNEFFECLFGRQLVADDFKAPRKQPGAHVNEKLAQQRFLARKVVVERWAAHSDCLTKLNGRHRLVPALGKEMR